MFFITTQPLRAAGMPARRIAVVASATRSLDDPRDWTATGGLEFEPVGVVGSVLRRR